MSILLAAKKLAAKYVLLSVTYIIECAARKTSLRILFGANLGSRLFQNLVISMVCWLGMDGEILSGVSFTTFADLAGLPACPVSHPNHLLLQPLA